MPYRTTAQADEDIIDIYLWGCREFGQPQAERYHAGLAAALDLIADNPRIARERHEFTPAVRLHPRARLNLGFLTSALRHNMRDWIELLGALTTKEIRGRKRDKGV